MKKMILQILFISVLIFGNLAIFFEDHPSSTNSDNNIFLLLKLKGVDDGGVST